MSETAEKRGHKCCGCCCDTKRAVIIIQIIFGLVLNCVSIALALTGAGIQVNDDELEQALDDAAVRVAIFGGVGIAVAILVIIGANKYNIILVSLGIVWQLIATALDIAATVQLYSDYDAATPIPNVVGSIIGAILLIYPHAAFISEVRSGVMGPDTYAQEEFSCCCV